MRIVRVRLLAMALALASGVSAAAQEAQDASFLPVRVFGPDGRVVEGARIHVAGTAEPVRTDAIGTAAVPMPAGADAWAWLLVDADGATPVLRREQRDRVIRVALRPQVPWEVELVTEGGDPVVGAIVEQMPAVDGSKAPRELLGAAQGIAPGTWRTGEDGVAHLPCFHGLGLRITVGDAVADVIPEEFDDQAPDWRGGAPVRTRLTWHPEVTTALQFVDESGAAVAGRECRVYGWNGVRVPVTTDVDGWARLQQPVATRRSLSESVPGRTPYRQSSFLDGGTLGPWAIPTVPGTTQEGIEVYAAQPYGFDLGPGFAGLEVEAAVLPSRLGQHGLIAAVDAAACVWFPAEGKSVEISESLRESGAKAGGMPLLEVRDAGTKEVLWRGLASNATWQEVDVARVEFTFAGLPVWDRSVQVLLQTDPPSDLFGRWVDLPVDGRCELHLQRGTYQVTIYIGGELAYRKPIEVVDAEHEFQVEVFGAEFIHGRVLGPTGGADRGTRVCLPDSVRSRAPTVACGPDGGFGLLARFAGNRPLQVLPGFLDPPLLGAPVVIWNAGKVGELDLEHALRIPVGTVEIRSDTPGLVAAPPTTAFSAVLLGEGEDATRPGAGIPLTTGRYQAVPGRYAVRIGDGHPGFLFDLAPEEEHVLDCSIPPPAADGIPGWLRAVDHSEEIFAGELFFESESGAFRRLAAVAIVGRESDAVPITLPAEHGTLEYRPWFGGHPLRMEYSPSNERRLLELVDDWSVGLAFQWHFER